jgi:hypothetical protein
MKMTMVAAYAARAVKLNNTQDFLLQDFDVPAAFLQNQFTKENCPRPLYMKVPKGLPHRLSGRWCKVNGALYGTKQANHMFDEDLQKTMALANFYPIAIDSSIYHRQNPTDSNLSCTIAMHVDDGLVCCTYKPYLDEALLVLTKRYGKLTHHDECTSTTGYSIKRHPDGSIEINQRGFLDRMLDTFQASNLPPVDTPSTADLFLETGDQTPIDVKNYQTILGNLIYLLKTRDDIRKEVSHLSTKNHKPVQNDVLKLARLLAYLNCTRDLSRRYYSDDPTIYITVDASYGVHPKGHSHTGFFVSVGQGSAPVLTISAAQKSCVATGSMEAEYIALSHAVKKALPLRYLLEQLGFPQPGPMIVYEDNISAINLAISPHITKNSKHIFQRHHYIRDLVKQNLAKIIYLKTSEMTADLLTKSVPPILFVRLCQKLMNSATKLPSVNSSMLAGGCQHPVAYSATSAVLYNLIDNINELALITKGAINITTINGKQLVSREIPLIEFPTAVTPYSSVTSSVSPSTSFLDPANSG